MIRYIEKLTLFHLGSTFFNLNFNESNHTSIDQEFKSDFKYHKKNLQL